MKILIIRFSSIGDIVLTSPVVRCLKKQLPNMEIHFCTKKAYVSLIESNPYVDKVIPLEKSLKELKKTLKTYKYDYIIDLHNNLRTLQIKMNFVFKSKIYSFNKVNIPKLIAVKFKNTSLLPKKHIVDRYFETVSKLGVQNDNLGLDYFFPEDFQIPELPADFKSNYIALVIGAQFQTKQFPVEKIIAICKQESNKKFIVLGGKEDFERGNRIADSCSNVFNSCGMFSLVGSAHIVKNANLVLTNDTGLMHIAAAFGKKIISIWGNTIPEFGMFPYMPDKQENFSIHQVEGLSCRPCSKIGYKSCPKGHFDCMQIIDENKISEQIEKFH